MLFGAVGIGFPVGWWILGRVLTPASQVLQASKPTGSGLVLPLCREIVEAHGGHLRIERRDGGGTAVVCWLPGE